jgi:hypothetical protein
MDCMRSRRGKSGTWRELLHPLTEEPQLPIRVAQARHALPAELDNGKDDRRARCVSDDEQGTSERAAASAMTPTFRQGR